MPDEIVDNVATHRYELVVDGHVASVHYSLKPGVITFIHTEVPKELGGRGLGTRLARHVLDDARARGLKVVARCPFITAYMAKHKEYDDLRL